MNFIKNYFDKIAVHFSRADFLHNGHENEQHFGPLQITFRDNSCLTFDENGDAVSISASIDPLIFKNDTDPNLEYWTEIILDNRTNWIDFVNTRLISASLLKNPDAQIVGCRLYFDNNKSFTYFNNFDDSKVTFDKDILFHFKI
jgi:hypothetical protein